LISFAPAIDMIRRRLGKPLADVESAATERWIVSPASRRYVKPSIFLAGQIERIERTEFDTLPNVVHSLRGDFEYEEPATVGMRLRNVDLFDGVLYAGNAARHLRKRERNWPAYLKITEVMKGALYESYVGNRWFGNWLAEDCPAYFLAEQYGTPVTTTLKQAGRHIAEYEALLGMKPVRVARAHFEELVMFEDRPNNDGKRERLGAYRQKLINGRTFERHPGAFLVRGQSGDLRILENEMELAESLAAKRGFKILEPLKMSVDDLVIACAGARVIAGVEGSQTTHGLMVMPEDATFFVVQPPRRAGSVFKMFTDRVGQEFSFVVAQGGDAEFRVDIDEVHRTLDMCP